MFGLYMSALLIFSTKCQMCVDVIQYIQSKPQLHSIVKYHDVNQLGVPPEYRNKITSVPVMLTKNQKFLNGKNEIMSWLRSLLPCSITHQGIGRSIGTCSLAGEDDESHFSLSDYGQSLQPPMTPELEAKINKSVQDAYGQEKR